MLLSLQIKLPVGYQNLPCRMSLTIYFLAKDEAAGTQSQVRRGSCMRSRGRGQVYTQGRIQDFGKGGGGRGPGNC